MGNTIHEESNKISLQKAVPSLRFERKPLPYKQKCYLIRVNLLFLAHTHKVNFK